MSAAIQKELVEVTELSTKRGEDRQAFLNRLVVAVAELADKDWDSLSKDAQDWYNNAADAKNAKKEIPDLVEAEEEPKSTRRRGAEEPAGETTSGVIEITTKDLKDGMPVTITTKRGKEESGHVIEVTKSLVAIKLGNGDEVEFDFERIAKMTTLAEAKSSGRRKSGDDDGEPAGDPVKVGAEVTVTTKRGKEVTGKIVELDDEVIVLDVSGKEEEFARERVESIKPVKGAAKDEPKSTRRGASAETESKGKDAGESKRSSNPGISIGTRIKELIADNPSADEAAIAKLLKKEGLEFRDNTLSLNFKDCHKFLDVLKERKMLKL